MKYNIQISSPILRILVLGLIIFLIFFIISKKSTLNSLKIGYQRELESDYRGVIQKIYNDKSNHNSPMVAFTNKNTIGINGMFRGQMEVGDSISKIKGDSIIQRYRNGQKFNIEIAPFYRKLIQQEMNKNMKK